jgi:CBS domain-containing protein
MTVSTILAGKGREVVSVEPSASLADAVRLLAGKRIGAAVILGADRRIAGIISERDIVRVLAERGAGALDEPVSQTMTRKVETCNESETVSSRVFPRSAVDGETLRCDCRQAIRPADFYRAAKADEFDRGVERSGEVVGKQAQRWHDDVPDATDRA